VGQWSRHTDQRCNPQHAPTAGEGANIALKDAAVLCGLLVHGPGGNERNLTMREDHFTEISGSVLCRSAKIAVGEKSHLANRTGLHFKLKTPSVVSLGKGHEITTICQMRDRLDRLFDEMDDTREMIIQNLSLSIVREDDWMMRFFLEDLAIGLFRPPFNVDCKR
jgi:hypothetical protein